MTHYRLQLGESSYKFGASINEVGAGDAIKLGPNRLEVIADISHMLGSKLDKVITTQSGMTFTMMDVKAYGKKVD